MFESIGVGSLDFELEFKVTLSDSVSEIGCRLSSHTNTCQPLWLEPRVLAWEREGECKAIHRCPSYQLGILFQIPIVDRSEYFFHLFRNSLGKKTYIFIGFCLFHFKLHCIICTKGKWLGPTGCTKSSLSTYRSNPGKVIIRLDVSTFT